MAIIASVKWMMIPVYDFQCRLR